MCFFEDKMENMKPLVREIKSKGQLTIPKKIREATNLEVGRLVSIIQVGDFVIVTPKRLELDEARRQIRKILQESGFSEGEILAGLKKERESIYEETYGEKSR